MKLIFLPEALEEIDRFFSFLIDGRPILPSVEPKLPHTGNPDQTDPRASS